MKTDQKRRQFENGAVLRDSQADIKALPNGLLFSCTDKIIQVWDFKSDINCPRLIKQLIGHQSKIQGIYALSDGRLVSHSRNSLKIWNFTTAECMQTIECQIDLMRILPNDTIVTKNDETLKR